jgi:peptidoglycan/LPS O-acetylase OafA/YrhL
MSLSLLCSLYSVVEILPATILARSSMDVEAQHEKSNTEPAPGPSHSKDTRPRTAYLDGLRGIAAVCVFNYHILGPTGKSHGYGENGHYELLYLPFLRLFYSGGGAAVAVFFVMSGFVLSQAPLQRLDQHKQCRSYLTSAIVRRPFRLYLPCLAISLIVVLIRQLPYGIYPENGWLPRQQSFYDDLILLWRHFHRICKLIPWHTDGLATLYPHISSFHTIPAELRGSIMVYLFFAALTFVEVSMVYLTILVTVLMVIAMIHDDRTSLPDFSRHLGRKIRTGLAYGAFIVGLYLLSEPFREGRPGVSENTPGWGYLTRLIPSAYDQDIYHQFWLSYGAIICVFALQHMHSLQNFLTTRPLQYLGKLSFMLYLTHDNVLLIFVNRFRRLIGHTTWDRFNPKWWDNLWYISDWPAEGMNLQFFVEWSVSLTVALFVAHYATIYIDDPCIQASKQISDLLGGVVQFAVRHCGDRCKRLSKHVRPVTEPLARIADKYVYEPARSVSGRLSDWCCVRWRSLRE